MAQLFTENSDDPLLTLFNLSHPDWDEPLYLVNNTVPITSNGIEYQPFPVRLRLPVDDGESSRKVTIEFDNVSRELIEEIRSVTDVNISVFISVILASNPDVVEIEIGELKLKSVNYNAQTITASLYMDDFLNTELSSEKYSPTIYPGLFD